MGRYSRREFLKMNGAAAFAAIIPSRVWGGEKVIRVGMVGLDTSHVIAFTKIMHQQMPDCGCKVVAGFPGGSPDVELSRNRVEGYTKQLREEYGAKIYESIEELCENVDAVMLESVDGRCHLEQARAIIAAKKPLFIDKPMAASVEDAIEIFRLAKENDVLCWSSSSLRYAEGVAAAARGEEVGEVMGCSAYGPYATEEHHPDLYWYGIHAVEILFAIMGAGCKSVRRVQTEDAEFVTGVWKDGRIGTFRGLKKDKKGYGALVFGSKAIKEAGGGGAYEELVRQVVKSFKTGKSPIPERQTLEIHAFMTAADISKDRGGAEVSIDEVIAKAEKKR